MCLVGRISVLAVAYSVLAAEPSGQSVDWPARPAEKKIEQAITHEKELGASERAATYKVCAEEVLTLEPNNVELKSILTKALRKAKENGSAEQAATIIQTALVASAETLAFRPLLEAPLPEGFPPPLPIGEIAVKSYPPYRLARTTMSDPSDESRAFFRLFGHITTNNIAMTAPVEMTYTDDAGQSPTNKSMAFLYQSRSIGVLGSSEGVSVVDVAPLTVVSLALRGDYTSQRVAEAEGQLQAWIKVHNEYQPAGNLRLMGYNSPMVPANRRYCGVQLPIKKHSGN